MSEVPAAAVPPPDVSASPPDADASPPDDDAPSSDAAPDGPTDGLRPGPPPAGPRTGAPPLGVLGGPPPSLQFASLYVGDLHPDISEAALYEAFQSAGSVASCRVCRDSTTRKSLGYGYVNYYNVEDAEKALETLNYQRIKGRSCRVMWSQRDANSRKDAAGNIFVKNLDCSIDNKALNDTFSIFGRITSCKVAMDREGKSKGYGFVHYEDAEAAKQAIERVNGMQIGDTQTPVFVGPFLKRSELENTDTASFTNLYAKNLPEAWDETALTDAFAEFGEVASSVIMQNVDGKRFALINYKDSESAAAAISAMHRKSLAELGGRAAADADSKPAAGSAAPAPEHEAAAEAEGGEKADAEGAPAADAEAAVDAELKRAEAAFPDDLLYVQRAETRAERREQLIKERSKQKGGQQNRPPGFRLRVRNLSEDMTSDALRDLFSTFGQVLHTWVKNDEDGTCLGLGFVTLSTMDEANKAATEMHLKVVDGKPLNVGLVESKSKQRDDGSPPHEKGGKGKGKGKGKVGEEKGKGKGKKEGKGKGKGKAGAAGISAGQPRPPGPFLHGLQPPLPPGIIPGMLPPGFLGGLPPGYPAGPLGPGMVRPATYSLPPAMLAGRTPMPSGRAPGQGLAPPPGMLLLPGASPPPIPMPRPPFPFPQAGQRSPMDFAMQAMPMPRMLGAPGGPPGFPAGFNPLLSIGRPAAPADFPRPPQSAPFSREVLSQQSPKAQKQLLGERLFPLVSRHRPDLAGKITGMMLELDNKELIKLVDNETTLKRKIDEAVKVLDKDH